MPLVQVYLVTGQSEHQKQQLTTAVCQAVQGVLAAPPETIRVWITELGPGQPDTTLQAPDSLIA